MARIQARNNIQPNCQINGGRCTARKMVCATNARRAEAQRQPADRTQRPNLIEQLQNQSGGVRGEEAEDGDAIQHGMFPPSSLLGGCSTRVGLDQLSVYTTRETQPSKGFVSRAGFC